MRISRLISITICIRPHLVKVTLLLRLFPASPSVYVSKKLGESDKTHYRCPNLTFFQRGKLLETLVFEDNQNYIVLLNLGVARQLT